MPSISQMIAELPTKADWNAGITAICAELKALNRPVKRRSYRVSRGERLWHPGRARRHHLGRLLNSNGLS